MTRKQIIAEITTQLKQYDEAGLVDYIAIDLWIRNALREFGGNIMEAQETTIEVKNSKAQLPVNFYSLALALKCEPMGVYTKKENRSHLQSSFMYKERLEQSTYWDNQLGEVPCVEGQDCKFVREEVYFHDKTKKAEFFYDNLTPLKLKNGYKKVRCDQGCPNLEFYESPYEIAIQGNFIQTNFKDGYIYLRYRGLPTDESGDIIIPEIQRNKLPEYIQYTCIRRTLQNLLLNSDDPDVIQKYQLFKQLENEAYLAAKNDSINEGMLGWKELIKRNNRRFTQKFELMYSNL